VTGHDQLDELTAVMPNTIAFLFRSLARHVDPTVDAHRSTGHCEPLRMIACRRAHDPGGDLFGRQLHQQVVGTAQLVRAHGLLVFALQVDVCAGGL
jgi:hypothetical protein